MKVDQQLRFVVISMQGDSRHSLISDGHYHSTSLGRDTWKSLIGPQGSLQPKCNKEGFNVEPEIPSWKHKASRARIGIVANNNNNCHTITKTRVESMHAWNFLIIEKGTLKPWDTSLCNEEREEFIPCYMISPFISINNHDYQHKNLYFATHHMAICALYDKHKHIFQSLKNIVLGITNTKQYLQMELRLSW